MTLCGVYQIFNIVIKVEASINFSGDRFDRSKCYLNSKTKPFLF